MGKRTSINEKINTIEKTLVVPFLDSEYARFEIYDDISGSILVCMLFFLSFFPLWCFPRGYGCIRTSVARRCNWGGRGLSLLAVRSHFDGLVGYIRSFYGAAR